MAKTKEAQGEYFVPISNPAELRSQILETSKQTVKLLQMHNDIISLREEKQQNLEELMRTFDEIVKLTSMLTKAIIRSKEGEKPEVILPQQISKKPTELPKAKKARESKQKAAEKVAEKTKALEDLEHELSDIESKIGRL